MHNYSLKNSLVKIINLIHDKRTEIIKHFISEKDCYLYNKLILKVDKT